VHAAASGGALDLLQVPSAGFRGGGARVIRLKSGRACLVKSPVVRRSLSVSAQNTRQFESRVSPHMPYYYMCTHDMYYVLGMAQSGGAHRCFSTGSAPAEDRMWS